MPVGHWPRVGPVPTAGDSGGRGGGNRYPWPEAGGERSVGHNELTRWTEEDEGAVRGIVGGGGGAGEGMSRPGGHAPKSTRPNVFLAAPRCCEWSLWPQSSSNWPLATRQMERGASSTFLQSQNKLTKNLSRSKVANNGKFWQKDKEKWIHHWTWETF